MAVGSEYCRLLEDFLILRGDLDACPFDAEGYIYDGPFIRGGEMTL